MQNELTLKIKKQEENKQRDRNGEDNKKNLMFKGKLKFN